MIVRATYKQSSSRSDKLSETLCQLQKRIDNLSKIGYTGSVKVEMFMKDGHLNLLETIITQSEKGIFSVKS